MDNVFITTSLDALMERATRMNNNVTDIAAIAAINKLINADSEGVRVLIRLILAKLQSPYEWELLQTLNVLSGCMENGGPVFQAEVGKFRFLNELIKLMSPKFSKFETPLSVRNRIVEMLYLWTLNYPNEKKIIEAYNMLLEQGVIAGDAPLTIVPASPTSESSTVTPKSKKIADDDKSKLLQKLLHSKNPKDLEAANSLIKTMVQEEERKEEEMRIIAQKRNNGMQLLENNLALLNDTLSRVSTRSTLAERELVTELYTNCKQLKPFVQQLIVNIPDSYEYDTYSQMLALNDLLNDTLSRYENEFENSFLRPRSASAVSSPLQFPGTYYPLVDFDSPIIEDRSSSTKSLTAPRNDMHALEEIFGPVTPTISDNGTKNGLLAINESSSSLARNDNLPNKIQNVFEDLDTLGKSFLQATGPENVCAT